jgi:hypothetical protein
LETLENSLIKTKSNEEQNIPESKEVVINLRELLICFARISSLTLKLIPVAELSFSACP